MIHVLKILSLFFKEERGEINERKKKKNASNKDLNSCRRNELVKSYLADADLGSDYHLLRAQCLI